MDWQDHLIAIYLYLCKQNQSAFWACVQRFSPHVELQLTDEEVITLYWFGLLYGHRTVKQIYTYADRHLRDWFPALPSYPAYVMRLNRLADLFAPLLERIQSEIPPTDGKLLAACRTPRFPNKVYNQRTQRTTG